MLALNRLGAFEMILPRLSLDASSKQHADWIFESGDLLRLAAPCWSNSPHRLFS